MCKYIKIPLPQVREREQEQELQPSNTAAILLKHSQNIYRNWSIKRSPAQIFLRVCGLLGRPAMSLLWDESRPGNQAHAELGSGAVGQR